MASGFWVVEPRPGPVGRAVKVPPVHADVQDGPEQLLSVGELEGVDEVKDQPEAFGVPPLPVEESLSRVEIEAELDVDRPRLEESPLVKVVYRRVNRGVAPCPPRGVCDELPHEPGLLARAEPPETRP